MDLFESVSGVLMVTNNESSKFRKELNRTNSLVRVIEEKQKASADELKTFVLEKARKFATENTEYVLNMQRSILDRHAETSNRITNLMRKVTSVEDSLLDFCKKSDVKRMIDSKADDVKDQLGRYSGNDHTPVVWALILAFACTLALILYVKPNGKLLKDLEDRLQKQADDQRRENEEKSAAVAALEEKVNQQSAEDEKTKEELAKQKSELSKQKAGVEKLRGEVEDQKRALEALEVRITEVRRMITNVPPQWDIVSSSGTPSQN